MDCLVLILLSVSSLSSDYTSYLQIVVLPNFLLIIADYSILYIVTHFDVDNYDPSSSSDNYFLQRRYEERTSASRSFTIKESGPFRIVVQNVADTAWDSPLIISRQISWSKMSSEGKMNNFSENIRFSVDLKEPLESEGFLTLIPETHEEEGSLKVAKHRSFGSEKGETVATSILTRRKVCLVRLVEEYRKDKMRGRKRVWKMEKEEEDEMV